MLGPIFAVDVLTSSRRLRYYLLRIGYAALLLLLFWVNYAETFNFHGTGTIQQAARFADSFFSAFAMTQLCAVLIVGPAMAAGTIAVERERRTIEYLFATDLTNREIVLGKLFARLLSTAGLVLVGLPILAIAALLGGIDPAQLAAVFVMTLSTMVAVSTLGIAVSVTAPRVRDAIGRAYVLLLALLWLPPMFQGVLSWSGVYYQAMAPVFDWMIKANPIMACFQTMIVARMRGAAGSPWTGVGDLVLAQGLFSLAMAVFATAYVRRVHLAAMSKSAVKATPRLGLRQKTRKPVGDRPLLWKETVLDRGTARWGIVGKIALGLLALGCLTPIIVAWTQGGPPDTTLYVTIMMSTVVQCGGLLLVAARAAACVTTEKEKDTWIMLLSTPLEAKEFLVAKLWGNITAFLPVLVLQLLIWGAQFLRTPQYAVNALWSLATVTVLLLFVSVLGTMYSLQAKNSSRSLGATLATVLIVGGGYMFCCLPCMIGMRGDEGFLLLAGLIPMLLSVPGIMSEWWMQNNRMGRDGEQMLATYVLGMFMYGMAAAVLWTLCLARFDTLNGRVAKLMAGERAPRRPVSLASQSVPKDAPIIDAEVIEPETGRQN